MGTPEQNFAHYKILSFEDRIASMIMAAVYSYSHIDLTLNQDQFKQLKVNKRLDNLQRALQGPMKVYRENYMEGNVIYRLYQEEKGEDGPFPESVTEINYDTTAVVIAEETLYIAMNYKQRMMNEIPEKLNEDIQYVRYGAPNISEQKAAFDLL